MDKRAGRMLKVVEMATVELDKVAQEFQTAQSNYQAESNQLESLKSYQQEYLQRLKSSETTTLQQLNRVQVFLEKLNQAVINQNNLVKKLAEQAEIAKQAWVEKKLRKQALEKVYQKLKKDHQVKLDKQEQRMLDDLSSQMFVRNNSF